MSANGGEIPAPPMDPDRVRAWIMPGIDYSLLPEPQPAPKFEVGQRITFPNGQVATVTGVYPAQDGWGSRMTLDVGDAPTIVS